MTVTLKRNEQVVPEGRLQGGHAQHGAPGQGGGHPGGHRLAPGRHGYDFPGQDQPGDLRLPRTPPFPPPTTTTTTADEGTGGEMTMVP